MVNRSILEELDLADDPIAKRLDLVCDAHGLPEGALTMSICAVSAVTMSAH